MDTQNLMPNPQKCTLDLLVRAAQALLSCHDDTRRRQRKGQVDLRLRWRTR